MTEQVIRYDDGGVYERTMGVWSRLVGNVFLDWLAPAPGLRWIDVGCGSGAFTELLIQRCAPAETLGIDPSEAQLTFARERTAAQGAEFLQGDALALPCVSDRFDAAVMALVIFLVSDPAKSVAEMARVVCPGGMIAAYAWDFLGGGHPFQPVQIELRALGVKSPRPPSVGASRMAALHDLWSGAGLEAIESSEITVQRTFADFEDFWSTAKLAATLRPTIAALAPDAADLIKARVRVRLPEDSVGRVTVSGRANAIRGRVPA